MTLQSRRGSGAAQPIQNTLVTSLITRRHLGKCPQAGRAHSPRAAGVAEPCRARSTEILETAAGEKKPSSPICREAASETADVEKCCPWRCYAPFGRRVGVRCHPRGCGGTGCTWPSTGRSWGTTWMLHGLHQHDPAQRYRGQHRKQKKPSRWVNCWSLVPAAVMLVELPSWPGRGSTILLVCAGLVLTKAKILFLQNCYF